jgi:hypothetical protein
MMTMNATKISIEVIAKLLEEAITNKDKTRTMTLVQMMKEEVRTDPVAVKWVVDPKNLTHLHDLLEENLGVPRKLMRVSGRSPNRQRRAYMFMDAMEHGVKRILTNE